MQRDRAEQLRGKAAMVVDALRRTGRLEVSSPDVLAEGPALGWRARVRLTVAEDGRTVGFLARGTHEVVDIPRCLVATDAVNEGIEVLRAVAAEFGLAGIASVELRSAPAGPAVVALVHPAPGETPNPRAVGLLKSQLPVSVGQGPAEGARQRWPLPEGAWLEAAPSAFTQVHDDANLALVRLVLGAVAEVDGTVVDACCGAGNFALPLAAQGRNVLAFDASSAAVRDLARAAEAQDLPVRAWVGDMGRELDRLAREKNPVGVVVLDPPRKGAKDALKALSRLAPSRVVYVACDPVSLARDARSLVDRGYALGSVTCVDMFPQTHHVETVAVFDQRRK
ncbi:MAG: class I SAM-dependent RNA methyltransferase [Deltaproteobacteria bacterium]|nr:class I SAM-dependent RNA methyltransferase [Deltaproteobacteria bacterium]